MRIIRKKTRKKYPLIIHGLHLNSEPFLFTKNLNFDKTINHAPEALVV